MYSSESSDSEREESGAGDVKKIQSPSTNQEKKKRRQWLGEDVKQLIKGVIDQIPSMDLTPWDKFDVNFDDIESNFTSEECRQKWDALIMQVRQYRTIQEVAQEMLMRHEVVNHKAYEWNKDLNRYKKEKYKKEITEETVKESPQPKSKTAHTKTKIKYPKHYPPKPKTGYMIFTSENYEKFKTEGVVNQQIFSKISALWRKMSAKEKAVYLSQAEKDKVDYLKQLKTYAEEHPDDSNITTLIKNEEKALSKIPKRKGTAENLDDSDVSRNHSITEYMIKNHKTQQSTSSSEDEPTLLNSTLEHTVMSPSKKKKKVEKEEPISPVKKRRVEEDQDSSFSMKSPHKKKKKKKHVWTAEDVFVEQKRESYEVSHPDMEEDSVVSKLKRKFVKLTDSKKNKYERLAAQKNENS